MKITSILSSLTLIGLGVAVGYGIAKKQLTEQYREDLIEVKEFYYNKLKESGLMNEEFEPDGMVDPTTELLDDEEVEAMIKKQQEDKEDKEHFDRVMNSSIKMNSTPKGPRRQIVNYNKPPLDKVLEEMNIESEEDPEVEEYEDLAGEYIPSDDPDYEAELEAMADEAVKRRMENESNGLPYVINHAEYEDAPEGYEKQCLYYYAKDRVLCEDDDSIVEEEEDLVGFDYEDVLDMQTIAWVRNDEILMLYEIHRIDDSYAKAVQGIVETPREREFRINGRRKQALDD